MAAPTVLKPTFPNVPKAPGVPALPRSGSLSSPIAQTVVGGLEGVLWNVASRQTVWGIYTSGGQPDSTLRQRLIANMPKIGLPGYTFTPTVVPPGLVVAADTVIDFGYQNASNISAFPVQRGAFANYNKVNNPYEVRIRLFKGGNVSERKAFLDTIERISKSLELYSVVTPERTYLNANIVGYEFIRRADEGAFSLAVDLTILEIREITPEYATTVDSKQPDGRPAEDRGLLQGGDVGAAVKKQATSILQDLSQSVKGLIKGVSGHAGG